MLSVFADALLTSTRQKRWDAPDHFKTPRGPRSNADIEKEIAERRLIAMRSVGMW